LFFLTMSIMFQNELTALYNTDGQRIRIFLYVFSWLCAIGVNVYNLSLIIKYKNRYEARKKQETPVFGDTFADPYSKFLSKSTMAHNWLYISVICLLLPFSQIIKIDIGSTLSSLYGISASFFALILTLLLRDDVYGLSDG